MIPDFHAPTPAAMRAHSIQLRLVDKLAELTAIVTAYGDNDTTINYGHVGSLAHVEEQITEVLNFLK